MIWFVVYQADCNGAKARSRVRQLLKYQRWTRRFIMIFLKTQRSFPPQDICCYCSRDLESCVSRPSIASLLPVSRLQRLCLATQSEPAAISPGALCPVDFAPRVTYYYPVLHILPILILLHLSLSHDHRTMGARTVYGFVVAAAVTAESVPGTKSTHQGGIQWTFIAWLAGRIYLFIWS